MPFDIHQILPGDAHHGIDSHGPSELGVFAEPAVRTARRLSHAHHVSTSASGLDPIFVGAASGAKVRGLPRLSDAQAISFLQGPESGEVHQQHTTSSLEGFSGTRRSRVSLRSPLPSHAMSNHAFDGSSGLSSFASSASASSFLFTHGGGTESAPSIADRLIKLIESTPPAALIPLHAASVMFAVPGHIVFELAEGYIFGLKKGMALAYTGKTLGALAGFGGARLAFSFHGIRDDLKKRLHSWPMSHKIATGVQKGGVFSVFMVKIAPVPTVIKTYSLGILTDIPWSVYVPGTLLGLLPTTAAHVYAGTLAPSMTDLSSGSGVAMRMVAMASVAAGCGFMSLLAGYYLHEHMLHEMDNAGDGDKEEAAAREKRNNDEML